MHDRRRLPRSSPAGPNEASKCVNCRPELRAAQGVKVVQELRLLVEEKRLAVMFLMEMRMGEERALNLQQSLSFPNATVVRSEGQSGGINVALATMMLWWMNRASRSHILTSSCRRVSP